MLKRSLSRRCSPFSKPLHYLPPHYFTNSISFRPSFSYYFNRVLFITSITQLSYIGYAYYDYKQNPNDLPISPFTFIKPILLNIDPETSHKLAVKFAQYPKPIRAALGMVYSNNDNKDKFRLKSNVWDLEFINPIGIAAGFDKHGECIEGMFDLGFGFVEIGSITPKPQTGNTKPRVWRLKDDKAVINRYGFNSDGHETVANRLKNRLNNMNRSSYGKLGINLGKNKYTKQIDAVDDYILGIEMFTEFADYLVINISSPNTPNLRDLQRREIIYDLLLKLRETRDRVHDENFSKSLMASCEKCKPAPPPLLVKIAPDLNDNEIYDIGCAVQNANIDGIIVSNTTIKRDPNLLEKNQEIVNQNGGLSGKPIFNQSNEILKEMYKSTNGRIPIIGVGGVSSVNDVYTKIKCGASLVQLYTGIIYNGPILIHEIIDKLDECAKSDGYSHWTEAIGVDAK